MNRSLKKSVTLILLSLSLQSNSFAQSASLLVVEQADNRISLYDTKNFKELGSTQVGFMPHEVAVSKDKKTAYVSNFGLQDYDETIGIAGKSISVIDLKSMQEEYRLMVPKETAAPHGVRLRPPLEHQLYTNMEKGDVLAAFDLSSKKIIKKFAIPKGVHNLLFSPDGKILWLIAGNEGIFRFDPDTGKQISHLKLQSPVRSLSYTSDQKYLMACLENEIVFLDPDNLKILRAFKNLDVKQILYADMTPDGKYIVAPAVWDAKVIILDTKTSQVVKKLETGRDPVSVKIDDKGEFAYVSGARSDYITRINLKDFLTEKLQTHAGPNSLVLL